MKINDKHLSFVVTSCKNTDMEGWLWKKGEVNTSYQKRWCVLIGNLFFYFEKRYDKEPIGVIILENCFIQLVEGGDSNFTFSIQFTGEGSRVYKLSADDEANCFKWIRALTNCTYRYLAILVEESDREVKVLKAAKELKEKEEAHKKSAPSYHKPLCQHSFSESGNGHVRTGNQSRSNMVKSNSLSDLLDKELDLYNELEDDFHDFDVFSDENKTSHLTRAKSSEAINIARKTPPTPKLKKNTKKLERRKKNNPQISKKKSDPQLAKKKVNSILQKNDKKSPMPSTQSTPTLTGLTSDSFVVLDFPTLHQIYRKDLERFLNI